MQPGSTHTAFPNHVFAVIPTYGERFHLVSRVIGAALENGVEKVILVDNGTGSNSRARIRALAGASGGKVLVVSLPENLGSAGGYKAGLERALDCADCEYIWLLDDDNCPDNDALREIVNQLREHGDAKRTCLVSNRPAKREFGKLVANHRNQHLNRNSFLGFHFLRTPLNLLSQKVRDVLNLNRGKACSPFYPRLVYAPYGGFFFAKELIWEVGLPNSRFFLYSDDHEYTYRFTRHGCPIYLVPSSIVHDLDVSWHSVKLVRRWVSLFNATIDEARLFYFLRNRTYFEVTNFTTNKAVYFTNMVIYLFLALIMSMLAGPIALGNTMVIREAIRSGLRADLGKYENSNF